MFGYTYAQARQNLVPDPVVLSGQAKRLAAQESTPPPSLQADSAPTVKRRTAIDDPPGTAESCPTGRPAWFARDCLTPG